MAYPNDRKYTPEHEWILVEGDEASVGITEYAQEQLGAVVYVDLPEAGDTFDVGDTFGEVESVKSVSELYMPVAGEVQSVNTHLSAAPDIINDDPYEDGWLIRISMSDLSELDSLLDAAAYEASLS
ncbi:MAG: glycine cleavage system protein GcvH [Actinomycetes bacterium]|jgi:glycine cleavage system H protein|nr:glycine cleavage system protein GcvH [Actinomycetes bacterium]